MLINELVLDEHAGLACITETWMEGMEGVTLSELFPTCFKVHQQPRLDVLGASIIVGYEKEIPLTRHPLGQSPNVECLHLKLGNQDRVGYTLVYQFPHHPAVSLPELSSVLSDVLLESSRLVALGEFNIHTKALHDRAVQDFMAYMATMGLFHVISGPIHWEAWPGC